MNAAEYCYPLKNVVEFYCVFPPLLASQLATLLRPVSALEPLRNRNSSQSGPKIESPGVTDSAICIFVLAFSMLGLPSETGIVPVIRDCVSRQPQQERSDKSSIGL